MYNWGHETLDVIENGEQLVHLCAGRGLVIGYPWFKKVAYVNICGRVVLLSLGIND